MPNHLSNEDAMLQEHDDFMRQVSESGVPKYLLIMYEEPNLKSLNDDYNQKTGEIDANEHSPDTSV
jgi:GGDEF domain-containing protein